MAKDNGRYSQLQGPFKANQNIIQLIKDTSKEWSSDCYIYKIGICGKPCHNISAVMYGEQDENLVLDRIKVITSGETQEIEFGPNGMLEFYLKDPNDDFDDPNEITSIAFMQDEDENTFIDFYVYIPQ